MDAKTIAEALGGKRDGNAYRCRCPAHGGDNPTALRIRDGERGVLLRCFTGCSFKEIRDALHDMGLWDDADPEKKREWQMRKVREEIRFGFLLVDIVNGSRDPLTPEDRARIAKHNRLVKKYPHIAEEVRRGIYG